MPRRPLLAASLLMLTAPAGAAPYQPLQLTPAQATADVALMRRALETVHPGLTRYRSQAEIDAAFARLAAAAAKPTTDLALWRAIALMLAEIHCDHTKPEPSAAIEAYRRREATHLPLRFRIVEGRMIVVSNDGQPGAPPRGAEIVAIDGVPVPVALAAIGRAVAYDGNTEQAIAAKLAADGDLMGDDLDEYWPAFYGFPTRWQIAWKRPGATATTRASLAPLDFKAWTDLAWPGAAQRAEFYKAVGWRLQGKTAVLRIDTFVNYRNPVDATAFLGGFFKALNGERADHLVLDLRENGGGSEDVSVALGRYLLHERFTWSKPVRLKAVRYGDLPAHIESWGDRQQLFEPPLADFRRVDGWWERQPRPGDPDDESVVPQEVVPDRFDGRVTVLTGPRNGSGATRTIAQLKDRIGATLIGEESAGSAEGPTAGHIFLVTLPNSGLKVRVPNAWNRTNVQHFVEGRGVAVDVQVTQTLADFDAQRDAVLDVALHGAVPAPALGAALAGDWTGTLDYRDFGSDRRVTLPTRLAADATGDALDIAFSYDDGPGKEVHSREWWALSAAGGALAAEGSRWHVIERRGGDATTDLTLVAEGRAEENGVPVEARLFITRRGDVLSITRTTRRSGEPFVMRHAYRLIREHASTADTPPFGADRRR